MTAGPAFDPAGLRACISCGFCLPSCPTYRLTGDEASSPRGRIALMRAIDDGTVDVFDAAAREQGSFCLGCRACEPACPADVPYGRLLEQLRDAQWAGRRRPLRIRPLLAFARRRWLVRLAGRGAAMGGAGWEPPARARAKRAPGCA
jgi:glycolate oxidase iron-sulfur subunit